MKNDKISRLLCYISYPFMPEPFYARFLSSPRSSYSEEKNTLKSLLTEARCKVGCLFLFHIPKNKIIPS